MKRDKYFVGYITFDDSPRIEIIRRTANSLAVKLFCCEPEEIIFFETRFQLDDISISPLTLRQRNKRFNILVKNWDIYKKSRNFNSQTFLHQLRNRLLCEYDHHSNKRLVKEMLLADKHVYLWRSFLESSSSLLCVMEDDALFYEDIHHTISRWSGLCSFMASTYDKNLIDCFSRYNLYIDCAGGFSFDSLDICADYICNPEGLPEGVIALRKIFTNTSCMYIMSRPLVVEMYKIVSENPGLRFLPSDWLINACAIDIEHQSISTSCFHFAPPLLQHSSVSSGASYMR